MPLRNSIKSAEKALSSPDRFRIPEGLLNIGLAAWLFVGATAALLIVAAFFVFTASISIPLILAAVIGAVSYPLAERLQKRGWSSTLAAFAVLVLLFAIIAVTIWITITGVVSQWSSLVASAEEGLNELATTLEAQGYDAAPLQQAAEQAVATGSSAVTGMFSNVLSSLASGISGIFGLFFGIFISVTLTYYILHDYDQVTGWLGAHIGLPTDLGAGIVEDGVMSMRGYFRGTTLTGLVVASIIAAGAFLLGVPLAIPIGLVTFVTCYIPFFGAIFSGIFAFLVALGAKGFTVAIALLVIVLVTQNVLQTVLSARFMGESLSLHPIVVLVVTMLGGTFGGLLGAALAAPLTALGVRATARLRRYREAGLIGEPEEEPVAAGA